MLLIDNNECFLSKQKQQQQQTGVGDAVAGVVPQRGNLKVGKCAVGVRRDLNTHLVPLVDDVVRGVGVWKDWMD